MTTIEINDDPISIQLANNESVTVPVDEIWKVNISVPAAIPTDGSTSHVAAHYLRINGLQVASSTGGIRSTNWGLGLHSSSSLPLEDVILTGGDEITADGSSMNISGFVIHKE